MEMTGTMTIVLLAGILIAAAMACGLGKRRAASRRLRAAVARPDPRLSRSVALTTFWQRVDPRPDEEH
jgi:hypothetical protein